MELGKIYERPWGFFQTLMVSEGYRVKNLTIKPGGKLSLQKHFKRSEHWVVVRGEITVTLDNEVRTYSVHDRVFVPVEAIHRLENREEKPAIIIEVQIGSYLGEDDIVRFEDVYGRETGEK